MLKKREPKSKTGQLCIDDLRFNEYYGMQEVFDDLYKRSKAGEEFTDLMEIILSRENILLAFRNIRTNQGSKTPGTDGLNIADIGKLNPEEVVEKVRYIIAGSQHGYRPKPVRRKEIPKPNGKTRPLGIPCIWDRLVQQCIKQVMEPICEAKFSDNSFGFRPYRCVEHAMARVARMLQGSNLHYVIEFDIKGFFDNVNHSKLIKQIWALGIKDKHLIWVIKRILTAPIKMPNGEIIIPRKGTPQGGIISPLLANINLNELDRWVESQWQLNPIIYNYKEIITSNGSRDNAHAYRGMRERTKLKEMWIVRYADDFRIFCKNRETAEKTKIAVTEWLHDRLKLEVSQEKTRIVNTRKRYSEFLGFQIKVVKKHHKYVITSHISEKQLARKREVLVEQAKKIAAHPGSDQEAEATVVYNSIVLGYQNYYRIATNIAKDFTALQVAVNTVLTNRMRTHKGTRLVKQGRTLTKLERERYGKSKLLRYVAGTKEPIYPIAYVQYKVAQAAKRDICFYTPEGRQFIHDSLRINTKIMLELMKQKTSYNSAEFADNRISLYSAQWGKCAVTGYEFKSVDEIHCHHKKPKADGGTDEYENLVLVSIPIHRLIHAVTPETIKLYMDMMKLTKGQMKKLNALRVLAGNSEIPYEKQKQAG